MSDRKIITADQAKALLDAATPGPWLIYEEVDGYVELLGRDPDGIRFPILCDVSDMDVEDAELIATAPDLARTVISQAAEIEKLKRGGAELGRIIKDQLDMVVDATGLHHLIRDDGDGDWGAVWMTLIARAKAHPDYRNPEATP